MSATAMGMALAVKGISPRAKLVLIAVCNSADEETFLGYPSRRHLADAADCSIDTIDRCLRELVDAGMLTKEERDRDDGKGQTSNLYRVFPAHTPSRKNTEGGQRKTTAGGTADLRLPEPQAYAAPPAAYGAAPKEPLSEPSDLMRRALARDDAWKALWSARLKEAWAIAGDGVSLVSGDIHSLSIFLNLCEPVVGDPCDWHLDVLPAVTALAAACRANKRPARTWKGVIDRAIENRDRRLAGLPPPQPVSEAPRRASGGKASMASVVDRLVAEGKLA